jgi:purine-nucleoside phosphorylase
LYFGTGLGQLVDHLEVEVAINYTDIPNFPVSTVEFKLLFGTLGKKVIVMQGRFHLYEGYSLQEITLSCTCIESARYNEFISI